jgi:hypothetical protein
VEAVQLLDRELSRVGALEHLLDMLGRAPTDHVVALPVAGECALLDALPVLDDGRQLLRPCRLDEQLGVAGDHRISDVGNRVDLSGPQRTERGRSSSTEATGRSTSSSLSWRAPSRAAVTDRWAAGLLAL